MEYFRLRTYLQVHNLNMISNNVGLNGFESYKFCFDQSLEGLQIQEKYI